MEQLASRVALATVRLKKMTDELQWVWNDGWILMAIYLSGRDQGAELYEIIAAADATNHAIPTAREMSLSLTKLIRCSLIQVQEDRYSIVTDYLSSIKAAYDGRGGLFTSGDKGLKWLQKEKLTDRGNEDVKLTETQMKAAYDQYIKAIR